MQSVQLAEVPVVDVIDEAGLSIPRSPETGEAEICRLADLFDLPPEQIANTPGGPAIYAQVADAFLPLVGSIVALREWMRLPIADLDDETPLDLLRTGDGSLVVDLLDDASYGQPG